MQGLHRELSLCLFPFVPAELGLLLLLPAPSASPELRVFSLNILFCPSTQPWTSTSVCQRHFLPCSSLGGSN